MAFHPRKKPQPRTCRVCGCTDDNCVECIDVTGEPCRWVEQDLCSACLPQPIMRRTTGYAVVVPLPGGSKSIASHGPGESVQIFDKLEAAMDLREAMRFHGNHLARVELVSYHFETTGLPVRRRRRAKTSKR